MLAVLAASLGAPALSPAHAAVLTAETAPAASPAPRWTHGEVTARRVLVDLPGETWDGSDRAGDTARSIQPARKAEDAFALLRTPLPNPSLPELKPIDEQRREMDRLIAIGDDAMIRRREGEIFALVDRLVAGGHEGPAMPYLLAALQRDPWALDYQLLKARLLHSRGDYNASRAPAELVLKYAEWDLQVSAARHLLRQEPLPDLLPMHLIGAPKITVVLVPVGKVDVCVLEELRLRLQETVGLTVLLRELPVPVPPFRRDPMARYLTRARDSLREQLRSDSRLFALFTRNGVTGESLESDSATYDVCRHLALITAGTDGLEKFDAQMRQLGEQDKQWDIAELLDRLSTAARPFLGSTVRVIGVTNLNTFVGERDFVFFDAEPGGQFAIVSYRRFTADFNQTRPDRHRLVERCLKSCLSCVAFMLGVPPCPDPVCPHANCSTLSEVDASAPQLCPVCRKRIQRFLAAKPNYPSDAPPVPGR